NDFVNIGGGAGFAPLEDGAEIGRWYFETPLPREWRPDEMDMKRAFPIEVALDEPLPFKGVLEVLPFCLWAVDAVVTMFKPVFASPRQPPLPVTSIANLDW